jgi:hypothetical protein
MTKKIFVGLFCATMLGFTSCSNDSQDTVSNDAKIENVEFNNLCSSLDQLGSKYKSPVTRAVNWNKWGGRLFSATVDGITACISGPAGWAVGPLCSWAFDEHWTRCTRQMSRASAIQDPTLPLKENTPTYVFNDDQMTKDDSIGYYHNLVLDDLANSGKKYVTSSDEIDYPSILRDCVAAAKKYGVNLNISLADQQKYVAFSKDVVSSFADCGAEKITINQAFSDINTSFESKFDTKLNLDKVEMVQNEIVDVLNSIDDEKSVREYADKVNTILKTANLNPELKNDLRTVTSVTVNSKLYWTSSEKELAK